MQQTCESSPQLMVDVMLSQSHYLTYTFDGSHKYWGAIKDSGSYVIVWGRIGSPGQSQRVSSTVFEQRLAEKKAKGYQMSNQNAPYRKWLDEPKKYFKRLSLTPQLFSAIEQVHLEQHTPKASGSKSKNISAIKRL